MSTFTFIEKQCEGIFEYHLKGSREGFIADVFYDKCIDKVKDEHFFSWIYEQGITNLGTMENTLLYTILLHHLTEDSLALITYFDEKEEIKLMQADAVSEKIEWRYCIEYTRDLDVCQDFKFLNPMEFLNAVNYHNKDLSNRYFYLSEIKKSNLGKYIRMFHSDVTNWNFVFCNEQQKQAIKNKLSNLNERPELNDFLGTCKMMINLQVGEDEGYIDYVLIHSKGSIKEKLGKIEIKVRQFIKEYEILLKDFEIQDENLRENWFMEEFRIIFDRAIYNSDS